MLSTDRSFRLAAVLALGLGFASAAFAGPPLICHPFTTGTGAPLLPWAEGKNNWHLPDAAYDRANLVADTLRLLSPDAAILDRMENMRRATIYAEENPTMAAELLRAVVERTHTKPGDARAEALKRGDRVGLCKSTNRASCDDDASWDGGLLVWVDANRNAQVDPEEPVLRAEGPAPAGITIEANRPLDDYVSYTSLGQARLLNGALQMGTFVVCSRGRAAIRVVLASSGRARIERSTSPCA